VNPTESPAEKPLTTRAGVLGRLRAFLHKSGAPSPAAPASRGPVKRVTRLRLPAYIRGITAAAGALAVCSLLGAFPALAAEPTGVPTLQLYVPHENGGSILEVSSTRVNISGSVTANGSSTEWSLERATNVTGPWTVLQSGSVEPGSEPASPGRTLRNLEPSTHYYFSLKARNASGEAPPDTIDFTTLPAGAPEVGFERGNTIHLRGISGGPVPECAPGVSFLHCKSGIEPSGAPAKYEFAYSESESGP
jgi:hypothetical protein